MKYSEELVRQKLNKCNIKLIGKFEYSNLRVELECFCGNRFFCRPSCIFRGTTKSCGCYNKESISKRCLINLVGRRFGKLEVKELLPEPKKNRKYKCLCDCGNYKIVSTGHLRNGHTKSCGCYRKSLRPNYNPNLTEQDRIDRRLVPEYIGWSKQILNRDNYTCQICKVVGGKLAAHHLDGWHWCEKRRFDLTNGITLCNKCHRDFHKKYGRKNNTEQQFLEYKGE